MTSKTQPGQPSKAAATVASASSASAVLINGDLQEAKPDNRALEKHGIVGFYKNDQRTRPFTLMRTQIAKRLERGSHKIIGLTSATPNAGKSFVALNLAASMARVSESRVLLVDLDLRRGSVSVELGLEPEVGLSDFLSGSVADLASVARRIEGTRLDILPTRVFHGDSSQLLATEIFDRLMASLRDETGNSIVFCDLPPALANDDAMLIMQKLDAYLLVVDAGTNNRKQLRNTMAMFSPTPCIGAVLNRYNGGLLDSYGYGYGYGYSAYEKYY